MKRISKRDLWMRFSISQPMDAEVLHLGRRRGRVKVDGVECVFDFPAVCRDDLLHRHRVQTISRAVPKPENGGLLPKGSPSHGQGNGTHKTALMPDLAYSRWGVVEQENALKTYAKANPVGSIVLADVLTTTHRQARLKLVGGPKSLLDWGSCHDYFPGQPLQRLALPRVGDRIWVIIRRFNGDYSGVDVSLHTWHLDQGFCNQEAGYKNKFDITRSHFARLPWSER